MRERVIFRYLTDSALAAAISSLKIARADLLFCADRDPLNWQLSDEWVWINRMYLIAVRERTARLALSAEKRAELAGEQ